MVTRDDLLSLSEPRGLAVSLFMPTERAGAPTRENHIRMKNRIKEVRAVLDEVGWDDREIDTLLGPALELMEDNEFWQHQQDGFALFLTEGEEHRFQVDRDLPDLSVVGRRYHLKPLLPLLEGGGDFYILAASLGKTRLFDVRGDEVREVDLPEDTPRSLAQFLRFTDDDPDPTVRWNATGRTGEGDLTALSHGGGPEQPDRKTEILDFFRALDNGVRSVVEGSEKPLVFMGVEYLYPLYREANHYPKFVEEAYVTGNPDQWSAEEVRERAWAEVHDLFEKPMRTAVDRFHSQLGTGGAGDDLEEVLLAGIDGRIDTLFVATDREQWGRFDAENRSLELADSSEIDTEELLDRAAVEALRTGARVFAVPAEEVPGEGNLAAIYRF